MNDNEQLSLIETHLKKLIAIAENRTQGEWEYFYNERQLLHGVIALSPSQDVLHCSIAGKHEEEADARFAAACAGNAEAGWKSTLAAIHTFAAIAETDRLRGFTESAAMDAINEILASWPIELLQ